jgi:hypothetical protein
MASAKPTAITDGVRAFYEQAGQLTVTQLPDVVWPAFEDLDGNQLRAWMLAFASTAEVSVRMAEAMLVLGIDEELL